MHGTGKASQPRLLDWRGGGAWLALAAVLVLAAAGWRVAGMLRSERGGAIGDGRSVASYGFDLSDPLVPAARIVAGGVPRDGIPALRSPAWMAGAEVAAFNESHRGKYLVSSDPVVGVVVGQDARAYPLRVLNWHEVVNDEIDGVPIAVTYHPLCDSVAVFDRRVAGETLEFGVSGLLYNSNLLLYDRRDDPAAASLWSQLQARAVAGPAARTGLRLALLPASLARWGDWLERYPATRVLRPEETRLRRYQRNPYGSYFTRGELRFPVQPMPPNDGPPPMSPLLAVNGVAYSLDHDLGDRDAVTAALQALGIELDASEDPPSVLVPDGFAGELTYSRWFAWHAHHADTAQSEGIFGIGYATSKAKHEPPK